MNTIHEIFQRLCVWMFPALLFAAAVLVVRLRASRAEVIRLARMCHKDANIKLKNGTLKLEIVESKDGPVYRFNLTGDRATEDDET